MGKKKSIKRRDRRKAKAGGYRREGASMSAKVGHGAGGASGSRKRSAPPKKPKVPGPPEKVRPLRLGSHAAEGSELRVSFRELATTKETTMSERKVSTDALETLGTIHTKDEKRDAIHLAVLPIVAGHHMSPGTPIVIKGEQAFEAGPTEPALAIVDPFLATGPKRGERFWAVLRPRLVTSLRHVWAHPAFPSEVEAQDARTPSEIWMDAYAKSIGTATQTLMQGAREYLDYGEYLVHDGLFEGVSIRPEFWEHFEEIEKTKVPEEKRANFLSCSC